MKFSIYLHQQYYEYLSCYGTIDEVVNKILTRMQDIDIESIPNAPNRQGARRLNINVTNEWYLELISTMPQNSSKVSLRKILYYVVDNELPLEWGWQVVNKYSNRNDALIAKHLDTALTALLHAERLTSQPITDELIKLHVQLSKIRSYYD